MTLPYRIGIYVLFLSAAFASGFFYGCESGRKKAFQSAVIAFQKREKIDNDISKLGSVELCIGLGGVPNECTSFMRRLDQTATVK